VPVYEVTIPGAGKFRIESQQELADDQVARIASGQADMQRKADPTSGMSFMDKFNAGMGKAFTDLGRGAGQLFNAGPTAEETRETRQLDAPLMKTSGGVSGNIAGNVAALAPLAVVPGANTVAGAGAIGAVTAGLQPAESAGERVTNMGVGGGLGAGVQALAGPVAQKLGQWGANKVSAAQSQQSQNAVKDQTLREGIDAGYSVPPSAVTDSFMGRRLESLGGKAALSQEAAIRNQPITDRLAREAASLQPDDALSVQNLRAARQQLAGPYREVAGLNPQAASDLEALQMARHNSKMAWKEYNRQGVRTAYNDAKVADTEAARLTQALEGHAQQAGKPDLVDALKKARQDIARNRQVQDALNRGTGSVDASVIGRALDNGAPLDGPLKTIGAFQQAHKPYMREGSTVPTPGVSKLEHLAAAALAGGGIGASDSPYGAAAGVLPYLAGPARSALLSRAVQEAIKTPKYSPGVMASKAAALNDPETRKRIALMARGLTLPMIPEAVNQ
jgi:hypothetical protein